MTPGVARAYTGLPLKTLFGCGLLVGVGTSAGEGCTSNHGIVGLSRLSRSSVVAVGVFFGTSVLAASLGGTRALVTQPPDLEGFPLSYLAGIIGVVLAVLGVITALRKAVPQFFPLALAHALVEFVTGTGFSMGLVGSGMSRPSVVLRFLDFSAEDWSPALFFVLIGAVCTNSVVYYTMAWRRDEPLLGGNVEMPSCRRRETPSLIFGSMIFGLGWGISGMCPGPAATQLASADPVPGLIFFSGLMGAYALFGLLEAYKAELNVLLRERPLFGRTDQPYAKDLVEQMSSAPRSENPQRWAASVTPLS